MLRMETVAERMADYLVGHRVAMPGSRKIAQAVNAARCLIDSAHACHDDKRAASRQDDVYYRTGGQA